MKNSKIQLTGKLTKMPPLMKERHDVLHRIYSRLQKDQSLVKKIFDFEKTVHADLDLSWIDKNFQTKEVGSTSDYQIVIATVKAGQVSDAHIHEIGSSSVIVLGKKTGFVSPTDLVFRIGYVEFPSLQVTLSHEVKVKEGDELDIPAYTAHQFENKSDTDAQVLIVTHPIISVEEGNEDIHFTK